MNLLPGTVIGSDPQHGIRVLLAATLVKDLRARVIEAYLSLPRRGVEIGGVLYGHATADDLRVAAFEEAPCEHRYGPSYALSEADRAHLREMVAQPRGETPGVVGFFRSFTSREPLLEAADEEFVRHYLPKGELVFLMLQPLSTQNCVASLRFFRNGELLPDTEEPPFAFDPTRMEAEESLPEPRQPAEPVAPPPAPPPPVATATPIPAAAPAPAAAFASAPDPDPDPDPAPLEQPILPPAYRSRIEGPPVVEPAPPERSRSRWWVTVLICLLGGILGAGAHEVWRLVKEPRWVELHLDARPAGHVLTISWDGTAARLTGATRALLAVNDGGVEHQIALTAPQIEAGRYDYTSEHEDIAVRLILYSKGLGISGDAVRVLSAAGSATSALSPLPVPGTTAAAATSVSATPPVSAAPPEPTPAQSAEYARVAVPASPIYQVQPSVPPGIRSRIESEIVIAVEVQLTERGGVSRATAETNGFDGLRRYLAGEAERAALQWRFTPAKTRQGVSVRSAKTVNFVFTP